MIVGRSTRENHESGMEDSRRLIHIDSPPSSSKQSSGRRCRCPAIFVQMERGDYIERETRRRLHRELLGAMFNHTCQPDSDHAERQRSNDDTLCQSARHPTQPRLLAVDQVQLLSCCWCNDWNVIELTIRWLWTGATPDTNQVERHIRLTVVNWWRHFLCIKHEISQNRTMTNKNRWFSSINSFDWIIKIDFLFEFYSPLLFFLLSSTIENPFDRGKRKEEVNQSDR